MFGEGKESLPDMVGSTLPRPGYAFVLPWGLHHTGGVSQVVVNLHREMVLAGEFEPLVLVSEWSAFRPIEKVIDGRRTVYVRLWVPWTEGTSFVELLKWVVATPFWMFHFLRFCRRHRVLAFNFHFASPNCFPIALLRFMHLYRGALIISFHGADLRDALKSGRIQRAMWRLALHAATAVVACSKAFAADVGTFVGKVPPLVHSVQNGLDVEYFLANVDRASGLPPALINREFILSIATWEWKKGLDTLVRAFADVRRTNPGIVLVLIGRAGGAEGALRTLAEELGIASNVLFLENLPHPQMGKYLEQAKAFCLPSRAEPFGIAILEAGAYRLPVVASRVGGIPEIIIDGETGLLVEPDDAGALAAALQRVLSDAELARKLGERLYGHVVDDFSWKRAYQQYRKLIL